MQQVGVLFHKFRFVIAGLFVTVFLVTISNVVTAIGSGSILATHTTLPDTSQDSVLYDSSNVVTAFSYRFVDVSKRAAFRVGVTLYTSCRTISRQSAQARTAAIHGTVATAVGAAKGARFVAMSTAHATVLTFHTAATVALFPYRIPGKIASAVSHSHNVSSIIRPADDTTVPVISHETSVAALAKLSALQQQEIAKLQAAQLTANERLDGAVIAGDPGRGGYPTAWDDARQDSRLDSWGMYNRECVSYAAWKVYQTYGSMPYWGGVGNANEWVGNARRTGIPTGPTPRVHSVAISMSGYYGHAMWVERVSGDMIYVSQYNYDLHGHYSEMWLKSSGLTYIYFR